MLPCFPSVSLWYKNEIFQLILVCVVIRAFQYKEVQFPIIVYSNKCIVWRYIQADTRSDYVSLYRWLRRKQIEKLAEQQAVKERARQLRLEAKRSKQLQCHLYNMSEAKSFRFTDHYNWRYLLNLHLEAAVLKILDIISYGNTCVLWLYSKLWKCYLSFGGVDGEFVLFPLIEEQNKFILQHCNVLYHVVHVKNWTNELYIPLLLSYFNISSWNKHKKGTGTYS